MEATTSSRIGWPQPLADPSGRRTVKPRTAGQTMVIDKGLGLHGFEDMLDIAGEYIDIVKIGFGTPALHPPQLLRRKIELAQKRGIRVMPGGTLLEAAVVQHEIEAYFSMVNELGFQGIEVSDGTIDMPRTQRSELIERGVRAGLAVYTEYGKKCWGAEIDPDDLARTFQIDLSLGAELVTIEGRESGAGVGIYDAGGNCRDEEIERVLDHIPDCSRLLWEAPHKAQQAHLLKLLGSDIHLGNIAPPDILSLEALRRGLRSDTLSYFARPPV